MQVLIHRGAWSVRLVRIRPPRATAVCGALATLSAPPGAAGGPLPRRALIAPALRTNQGMGQGSNILIIELNKSAPFQTTRQHHGAVANADQAADGVTDRFKHAAHFAVATFRNRHAVPAISAFAAAGFNGAELSHAIIELHTFEQALFFFGIQGAQNAHGVFTLQTKTRVHQLVGQLPGTGQQQQTFGVQVQASDRLPLALKQLRQTPENGWAVLWIVMRYHLARGLVVRNHAWRWRVYAHANGLAVDFDVVAKLNALTDVCRLRVHGNSALEYQLLHLQARAQARLRQHFVQLGAFRLCRQNTLGWLQGNVVLISIELARDHIFELVNRHSCRPV